MGSSSKLDDEGAQWAQSTDGDDAQSRSDDMIELGPARSQNGHGCADLEDEDETGDDPFEVSFDGDDDPMCPRSSE